MKLPIDNLCHPIKILIGNSSGSGFMINNKNQIYLVTAKHVLYGQDPITKISNLFNAKMSMGAYLLQTGKVSRKPHIFEIDLEALSRTNDLKIHADVDLVVIKLGNIDNVNGQNRFTRLPSVKGAQISEGRLVGYNMESSRKFDDVEITNDIFVLGYPVSLSTLEMKQLDYDSPLVRKGIVAGKNYLNKSLILDCPVYGGNSGGLVLEINEINSIRVNIHLIGVVVQFIPFVDEWRNVKFPELVNANLQNSGYSIAIPVDYIYDLIE